MANLEFGNSNPAAKADLLEFEANVSYSGTQLAPVATFSTYRTGWCAMYAKNVSTAAPVVAFANTSSVSIELNRVTDTLTLYACCGVTVASRSRPVRCPSSQLFSTVVDIAAHRTAATADIVSARSFSANGALSFSATSGERCDNYQEGFSVISTGNENQTGGLNCTCTAAEEGTYEPPTWECVAPYPALHMLWGGSSAGIIVGTAVGAVVVMLFASACICYRKLTQEGPKGLPTEIAHVGVAQQDHF